MNKVSIYILLILIFLGISTNFSKVKENIKYIQNEQVLSGFFGGSPISLILIDSFTTGFLVKTYYLKCRLVAGFSSPEIIIIQTSKSFWEKNKVNSGMSIFRRDESTGQESVIPMPPGTIFINNPSFGRWAKTNSGSRVWKFHRAYRKFPQYLRWGEWRPNRKFYDHLSKHILSEVPTFGPNTEFGSKGNISKKLKQSSTHTILREESDFGVHLKKLFSMPRSSSE